MRSLIIASDSTDLGSYAIYLIVAAVVLIGALILLLYRSKKGKNRDE